MRRLTLTALSVCLCATYGFSEPHNPANETDLTKYSLLLQKKPGGQPPKIFNGFSLGANVGVSWFMGDLAAYKFAPPLDQLSGNTGYNWSVFARREIKYGLAAKLQFDKGTLNGGRAVGNESPHVRFETDYQAINLMLSFDLVGAVSKPDHNGRFYLLAEIGGGVTFYRSLSFWGEGPELVRDFEGYTTQDEPATQRYQNMERAPMARTMNIPVGLTAGYMLNHRLDVNAQVTLNNVMTDRLETWARDRSARDKYAFATIGLRYNFNRTEDDFPERKRKKNKKKSGKSDKVSPNELDLGDKLKPVKGFKSRKKREDELMRAMMRMYELQLQLFQLQYLTH